jgi:hypothetical protein
MSIIITMLLATAAANAEPLQPQPKIGAACPSGYQSSGGYCVPGPRTRCKAMPKLGSACPSGYTSSFHYCVETGCQSR